MSDYLTEQEQIELLKNWVKQYSFVIISGVILAVLVVSGWRYWQERQTRILTHASNVYDELLVARSQNNPHETQMQAHKLFKHYSNTSYGSMAALMLARSALIKKDYLEAEKQLTWVMNHSKISSLRQIARLRLARVLLTQKKMDASLTVLDKLDDKTFLGLVDEVKGDVYLAMNKPNNARDAYKRALQELPNAEIARPLLQMKYDNLTTT